MNDSNSRSGKSPAPETVAAEPRSWRPPRALGLARALLKAGYGTRREADEMVSGGRVRVGNRIVTDPRQMVEPGMEIYLDGELLQYLDRRYFALYKPPRVVCGDEGGVGRKPISDYFPDGVIGVAPAGRMDSMTTGLLLVSNDSTWNNMVTTTSGLEQEYRLQVEGELTDLEISVITAGVLLPGRGLFKPESLRIVECLNGHTVVNISVREGKVRNLRRMLATLRHKVMLVRRIRIGEIRLVDLAVGSYRELSAPEIASVKQINAMTKNLPDGSGG